MLNIITAALLSFMALGSLPHQQTEHVIHQSSKLKQTVSQKVNKLIKVASSIDPKVLTLAVDAYYHAYKKGEVHKPVLTVIDYSKRSNRKRLWIFDLKRDKLLFNTYVSHGKGTGGLVAKKFSNQPGSHQTSLGVFVTGQTYQGDKGLSLRLSGREPGINDKAQSRAIVMHGAWYTNPQFIQHNGYAGRSWGCPAIPTALVKPIINTIKKGSVIFAYYPNQQWLSHSQYLA